MATNADGVAFLSAKNYGSAAAICVGLEYGFEVLSEESESSQHSTFYPHEVVDSQFTVMLAFRSYASWKTFNEWMEGYGRKFSVGGPVAAMVVAVPSRRFIMVGIPSAGFMYGDDMTTIVNRSTLTFKVVTNLIKGTSDPAKVTDPDVQFFYPTGKQLSAKDRADDYLYNTVSSNKEQSSPGQGGRKFF